MGSQASFRELLAEGSLGLTLLVALRMMTGLRLPDLR
jgi:hypothetical protein